MLSKACTIKVSEMKSYLTINRVYTFFGSREDLNDCIQKSDIGRYFNDDTEYYDDVLKQRVKGKPDLLALIDRQISAKNVVGIDYSMQLISKDPKDSDSHASVIVGREMRAGQCYYKIRNSWGPECGYNDGTGKIIPRYNSKVECTEGHVWVKATDLKANLSSIAYIKP